MIDYKNRKIKFKGLEIPFTLVHLRITEEQHKQLQKKNSAWIRGSAQSYYCYEDIYPRGGATLCRVEFPNLFLETQAVCSLKDNFVKAVGRELACKRMENILKSLFSEYNL